ncbi:hypothetical protein SMD44_04516 [Streptomyces alboflavus]|uniref:Uncharacterized protein n=1 Tax=Streptomyces alboflavus TaxID=67267 RepID=A0A1Z1WFA4_9ACTN|nr:hypothetical protein SMD44_04516 [Streptomyces alboflavus]
MSLPLPASHLDQQVQEAYEAYLRHVDDCAGCQGEAGCCEGARLRQEQRAAQRACLRGSAGEGAASPPR